MHVALGFSAACGNLFAQRLDQRNCRIAGTADGDSQRVEIEQPCVAAQLDVGDHLGRDQADACLCTSQRSLEIEHALHPALIRKNLAHFGLHEVGIEKLIARSVHITTPD